MTELRGEALYWEAFERLKSGETQVIDTDSPSFKFTKDNVAIEAGKGKGFVKQDRYPDLCDAISEAENARCAATSKKAGNDNSIKLITSQKKKANARYTKLKAEHDLCLEKMMNLLRENFELRRELDELKKSDR